MKKQGGTLRHVVCDKAATLVYLANQACIEFHVFLSRVDSLECPDQVVVDFDTESADDFPDARRCALWLRDLLASPAGCHPSQGPLPDVPCGPRVTPRGGPAGSARG